MIKITQYVPLHLSFFLVLGVLLGYYFFIPIEYLFFFGLAILALLVFFFQLTKKYLQLRWIFQLLTYIFILLIGLTSISLRDKQNQKAHYSHTVSKENSLIFQIDKKLKSTLYHDKYYADVLQINNTKSKGKILVNVSKDSVLKKFKIGETYLTTSILSQINKPLNPHGFDYSNYLKKQKIHHQISLNSSDLLVLPFKNNSLRVIAAKWRNKIQTALDRYPFKDNEMAIINAIVLGQRQSISKDLLNSYAGAGAIHILAVSGLHVGILFLILGFVLKPLEKIKNGRHLKTLLIILFLWSFALLTGLSGSVVRAVTMFTFIAIGLAIRSQRSAVLHALITSFFILVLIHPYYLFDVGFQMSYTAVLGIVLLYPKLNASIPRIKWAFPRKIWELFCVSVTATIGTLPISLYYFHQFPGLFFVSNIVIVPFLGIIMGMGILVVILALINILPTILVQIYGFILSMMNTFIEWVAHQEQFLFKNISFSIFALLASYLVIAMGYRWWIDKKTSKLLVFLTTILIFESILFIEKYERETSDEFVIFHKSKESILGIKKANTLQIFHSFDSIQNANLSFVDTYKVGRKLTKNKFINHIPNVINYKNLKILVVDSLGIYNDISFTPNIVLLRQSPRINLERLLQKHKLSTLIIDGSNYKSYVVQWQKTCLKNNINFHYTGVDGAYTH